LTVVAAGEITFGTEAAIIYTELEKSDQP